MASLVYLPSRLFYSRLRAGRYHDARDDEFLRDLYGARLVRSLVREDLYAREITFRPFDDFLRYKRRRLYPVARFERLLESRERHWHDEFSERLESVTAELRYPLDKVSQFRTLLVSGAGLLAFRAATRCLAALSSSAYERLRRVRIFSFKVVGLHDIFVYSGSPPSRGSNALTCSLSRRCA